MSSVEWKWITPTQYVLESGDRYVRAINVRDPYMGEPPGKKYVVSGNGHDGSTHDSLEDAVAAAEASL